jgi:hypothetical protein
METAKYTILPLYGGASKSYTEMSKEEQAVVGQKVMEKVKERAFSRGLPIYIGIDTKTIAEYANGKRFVVESDGQLTPFNG